MSFKITIKSTNHNFIANNDEILLSASIDAGLNIPYGCRNGACGACKATVLFGQVDLGKFQSSALSEQEIKSGKILLCCATAHSDLTIDCREASAISGIAPRILPARVQKMDKISHDVMVIYLKLPSNERLQFVSGQYIEFLLKDGKRRAFSLANAPHNDEFLELHLRLVPGGQFTQYVFNEMQEKAILRIEGPYGSFYLREESDKPIIFVAGGTGFAPIKGIVEHMMHQRNQRNMKLYWGVKSLEDLYMKELPSKWSDMNENFDFVPVLSDPRESDQWTGRTGYVHHAVLEDYNDLSPYQVYCCGAPEMVHAAHESFMKLGLPEDEFFSDAFTYANPLPKNAQVSL